MLHGFLLHLILVAPQTKGKGPGGAQWCPLEDCQGGSSVTFKSGGEGGSQAGV